MSEIVENVEQVTITKRINVEIMSKNELTSFIGRYVKIGHSMELYQQNQIKQLKKINAERSSKLAKLDRGLESFKKESTQHYRLLMKAQQKRIVEKYNKKAPGKFKRYWVLSMALFFGLGLLTQLIFLLIKLLANKGDTVNSLNDLLVLAWGLFLGATTVAATLWVLKGIFWPIWGTICKILIGIGVTFSGIADIIRTRIKGVNLANAKSKFDYEKIKNELTVEYRGLEVKINDWNKKEYEDWGQEQSKVGYAFPKKLNRIDYLSYIYNQLELGAATTWKECVQQLQAELRHAEITEQLQTMNNQLQKNVQQLGLINDNLENQFENLNRNIDSEFNVINSRIDGLFEGTGYYNYRW